MKGDQPIPQPIYGSPPSFRQEQEGAASSLSEITANARKGNPVAFTSLFHLHHSRIFTYLVHILGRREEAEDLAQETFLKAWRSLHTLEDDDRFGPWLYRIATHTALDHLRKQKHRQEIWVQSPDGMFFEQEEGKVSEGRN